LIQAEIALKNGMIYIFKDEFKYVIETDGLDDGSMVICDGYCHAGQLCRRGRPTYPIDKSHT